jgi:hypothetical protein
LAKCATPATMRNVAMIRALALVDGEVSMPHPDISCK